ncbi:MAG: SusC/RagA family TonB-linked outer membrane protein [Sphingobacterium sp.]
MKAFLTSCLTCCFLLLISAPLLAQLNLSGTITGLDGQPINSATIAIQGTSIQTSSNAQGEFQLEPQTLPVTLVVSYIGFETLTQTVTNASAPLTIKLTPAEANIDEVVVVGYGTQSRRTLTTAISKVDGKALQDIPISTVGEGLRGKIAGARVYQSNNSPGADAVFRIRGGSSINKTNDPLVLVDGIERSFSGVNPNDVESIEVLKDAASTAIYGSRASNGVVLITTKNGKNSASARITFDANYAFQSPESTIDFMNAKDYISTVRPAVALSPNPHYNFNSGYSASSGNDASSIYSTRYLADGESVPAGYSSMADPLDASKTIIFQDNDYQSLLFRNAAWQNYYVGLDGGSETVRYAGSAGYTKDDGVALGTDYNRFTARGKVDVNVNKRLTFNTMFDFSNTLSSEFENQKNVIARGLATPPTQLVYYPDGRPTPGYNASSPNPVWWEYTRDIENKDKRLSLSGGLDYKILEGLKASAVISNFSHTTNYSYFEKAHEFSGLRTTKQSNGQLDRLKFDGILDYNKSFVNDHDLTAMLGYSYQQTDFSEFSAAVNGASSDKVPSLSAGPNKTDADSDKWRQVLIGYFGRANYSYKDRYLLTGTFRYDGSSLFAKENRWGFFPGVSAGWIISEEEFFKNQNAINYMKLRSSFGQTGNNSIGLYDALGRYVADTRYDGNAGIRASIMPNRELTWETSTQFDLGLDFNMLQNKLTFQLDYFNKTTENLLFSMDLPNTSGFSTVQTNVGKVRFHGFDIEIGSQNIQTENFSWSSSLTWSFVKNKVLELPSNGRDHNRIGGTQLADGTAFGGTAEGEPLYRYYGYQVDHILQNSEQAAGALYDESARGWDPADGESIKGRKQPGDYEWIDRDGDGVISSKDQFELGVTVPHSTGGLQNTFTYKAFSLNVFVDWALGHSINHNAYMRYFMNTFANNYTLVDAVNDSWKQPGDNAKYARFTANDPDVGNSNFSRTSSAFNYKGDYLALRELTFLYNLPTNLSQKMGISNLQLALSGQNLAYFWAGSGMGISPEVGTSSTYSDSYFNYPAIRRFSLGIKLTL